jgi:formylglycine-generating enzyme required for sulfatase activity
VTVANTLAARFFRLMQVPTTTADGMALIPAGVFTMGNSIGDSDITNANPTNVYVSAFYMDTNLVSLSQWQQVYSYATSHGYTIINAGTDKAANTPVGSVDWYVRTYLTDAGRGSRRLHFPVLNVATPSF